MAVQAQYPSSVLLLNRSEQERKSADYSQAQPVFLDQSGAVFFSNGATAAANPRKRGREATVATPAPLQNNPVNLVSLQPQHSPSLSYTSPTLVNAAQIQTYPPPPLVSTGLRLAFESQQHNHPNHLLASASVVPEELAAQINQQTLEIDGLLRAQGEQLRRTLTEGRRRHYRALLVAAEESAARRLREKEAELERVTRRSVELEDCLARLRAESQAWQAKAMAEQAAVVSLHAQLQAAASAAPPLDNGGESPAAEDAESAHVDPGRGASPTPRCRGCRGPACVVLLPCRHLCLCVDCDAAGAASMGCPVCLSDRTGSVEVFLS